MVGIGLVFSSEDKADYITGSVPLLNEWETDRMLLLLVGNSKPVGRANKNGATNNIANTYGY
jgi:hypothetical protein